MRHDACVGRVLVDEHMVGAAVGARGKDVPRLGTIIALLSVIDWDRKQACDNWLL